MKTGVRKLLWTCNTLKENHLDMKKQKRNVVLIEVDKLMLMLIPLNFMINNYIVFELHNFLILCYCFFNNNSYPFKKKMHTIFLFIEICVL